MSINDPKVQQAYKQTVANLKNSYAPYSKLHVGAYLGLVGKEQGVLGVNVENASYGGTICAERSAIVSSISQFGREQEFSFLIVISDAPGEDPIPPCAICLQVIKEFVDADFDIYLGTTESLKKHLTLKDLLPHSFSSAMLPDTGR